MDKERKLKQIVFEMVKHRKEDGMLMDAPEYNSWRGLYTQTMDRDKRRV